MSHVVGKNRKELLAMAKGHIDDKKGFLHYFHPSPWSYISFPFFLFTFIACLFA